jgi:DNA-binding CsgD family transcriptional regulator
LNKGEEAIMTENQTIALFKALADKSRLQIIKNLSKEPMYVELLAKRLGITPSTVSFHLKKLMDSGLVTAVKDQYYVIYHMNEELLGITLKAIIQTESPEEELQVEREEQYRKKVIKSFMEYGKLKSIPVQIEKRKIILYELAKAFEADKEYTEREVNLILADYFDDFCTLRKYMAAEGILGRREGIYKLQREVCTRPKVADGR